MLSIAQRELSALFKSPMAWLVAAALQVFFAWFFLSTLEQYMLVQDRLALQDHAPGITGFMTFRYLAPCAGLLLIICPLLGMRAYADEYRQGTFILLQSAPLSVKAIVLGKFLGNFLFIAFILILALIMPLTLGLMTRIDFATLTLSFLGLLAVAAFCTSVALLFSSLTRHALVAAIASTMVLVIFWSLGKTAMSDQTLQLISQTASTSNHLGSFFQGLLNSGDLIYFAALTLLALMLTLIRVGSLGWSSSPGR